MGRKRLAADERSGFESRRRHYRCAAVALELLAEQEGVEITYTLTRKDKLDEPVEAQEATA